MKTRELAVVVLILIGICAVGIVFAYVLMHGPLR